MIALINSGRKYLICGLYLSSCMQLFSQPGNVEAKSAARSGGGMMAAKAGRSGSSAYGLSINSNAASRNNLYSEPKRNLTVMERLKRDLFQGYDKDLTPVMDYRHVVEVEIDLTFRQILDLDEKNQVLKSLIWYKQYWIDVNLKWEPSEYDGMENISIPTDIIWKPDLVLYEGVGTIGDNNHLPFVRLSYNGQITLSEPRIVETSCSVDTALFPFDSQKCDFTFVSWTQSVKHIDLRSQRPSQPLKHESLQLFINTGEWVLKDFGVTKRISSYGINDDPDPLTITEKGNEDNTTNHGPAVIKVSSQTKVYIEMPADRVTTEMDLGKKLTNKMFAEVMYSLVIQRNSSLYMQSMLFPSILLTTVALLGFFLPPDSGERVGLQITILLTFMVFLLTVGEMFPASTGPYIGIYFVISMAQLGVNIIMTIMVLYLHFKPCVQDKSTWAADRPRWYTIHGVQYEGDSMIPVRTRRILQFLDKYFDVAEDNAVWMRPICYKRNSEDGFRLNECSKSTSFEEKQEMPSSIIDEDVVKSETGNMINSNELDDENKNSKERIPDISIQPEPVNRKKSQISIEADINQDLQGRRKSSKSREFHKIIRGLQLNVKDMVHNIKRGKEKDEDDEFEESIEKEQEEWKSVARAVDSLFFRLYLFIVFVSYIGLIGVAIQGTVSVDHEI